PSRGGSPRCRAGSAAGQLRATLWCRKRGLRDEGRPDASRAGQREGARQSVRHEHDEGCGDAGREHGLRVDEAVHRIASLRSGHAPQLIAVIEKGPRLAAAPANSEEASYGTSWNIPRPWVDATMSPVARFRSRPNTATCGRPLSMKTQCAPLSSLWKTPMSVPR